MFCKYCGKSIPDGAKHCPACGRELSASAGRAAAPAGKTAAAEKGSNTILYLFIALMVLPGLFSLRLGGEAMLFSLISLVRLLIISAIGIAALFMLIQKGLILPERLRGLDLLMWVLWSYPSGLASAFALQMLSNYMGYEAAIGYSFAQSIEATCCNLGGLWSWVLLILLCMARSGKLNLTKKFVLRAGLLLAGWSVLLFVLCVPLTTLLTGRLDGPEIPLTLMIARISFATLWLRHGFAVVYMLLYGSGRLCPGLDALFPLALALLSLVFTLAAVVLLRLNIQGVELARILAYLVCCGLLRALRSKEPVQ